MLRLSEEALEYYILQQKPFAAELWDHSLYIRISQYAPYIGTAIHHGHRFRPSLRPLCLLNEKERYYEEDPCTGHFITSLPIVLIGRDSRYAYDLNRAPKHCIYDLAWGKAVWHPKLPETEKQVSLEKHARYYRILDTLLTTLHKNHPKIFLLDMHSYNYQRQPHAPTFNLGTAYIHMHHFEPVISALEKALGKITLAQEHITVVRNQVFQGKGYQAHFIQEHHAPYTLNIPLELKKIYMDENSGMLYPHILKPLSQAMHACLKQTLTVF